ncbi:MAG: efflux RND transporter periplasmic adaptor subunit, partial [Pseudomonadota bacterium]|nr:efflux RND transporter periplasmic adaptor subunit [Pseudomonadota bacterium]
ASVTLGQQASARLISGEQVTGRIRYISNVSNEGTNTFTIEVAVANPDNALLAGLSGEIFVTLKQVNAIKITPSVMALDEDGNLGVKVVENNRVRFISIDMVKSEADGVWLAGLGEQAEVITRGQGFVRDGDSVEVVNN